MPKVLVTGMSGTGKSTVLEKLGENGHRVVDTDTDAWCRWVTEDDGDTDWIWREDAITELLDGHREGKLFVSGCKSNQYKFYKSFDHVVLLSAPEQVMLERIAQRSNNPYGKSKQEREMILEHRALVEPLLRRAATVEIDTSVPVDEVVRQLEQLTA
ncbi:shikimate kinase [Nocardia panacis]|uniref:Shikimate kinase n=1 Tax=Nocardia panacis TaxID=2340916 RepID=A0A3A4K437_9NOCA|nr:AAA family ATPase [Nocardia panacis]RJO79884.1 shikimate kinase [Nocardia panacis]